MTEGGPIGRKITKCYKELHPTKQQGRQCTSDVTLRRIRVTSITAEKTISITYSDSVCL
jgi:hypothetical protein